MGTHEKIRFRNSRPPKRRRIKKTDFLEKKKKKKPTEIISQNKRQLYNVIVQKFKKKLLLIIKKFSKLFEKVKKTVQKFKKSLERFKILNLRYLRICVLLFKTFDQVKSSRLNYLHLLFKYGLLKIIFLSLTNIGNTSNSRYHVKKQNEIFIYNLYKLTLYNT